MSSQAKDLQEIYSTTELKVAHVWMAVLDLEDEFPSITRSFADLGGDSVAALLCISRLRNVFGPDLDVDISDFFQDESTIKNFARSIEQCNSTELSG